MILLAQARGAATAPLAAVWPRRVRRRTRSADGKRRGEGRTRRRGRKRGRGKRFASSSGGGGCGGAGFGCGNGWYASLRQARGGRQRRPPGRGCASKNSWQARSQQKKLMTRKVHM